MHSGINDVTVAIPVYNEVEFIEAAVLSIVNQVEEVIICDNCSIDGTVDILKELEQKFDNITLILQDKNYGASNSAKILFGNVKTKYMMCMGGHDLVPSNYVEALLNILKKDKDVIFACSPVEKIDEDDNSFEYDEMKTLMQGISSDNQFQRVNAVIKDLIDCSIFYGLTYTEAYLDSVDYTNEACPDHIFICSMAAKGKYKQCKDTRFYRRYLNRHDSNFEYMKRLNGDVSSNSNKHDLSYMIKAQLNIIDSIETSNNEEKKYYCELARTSLKNRFAGRGGWIDYRPVVDLCKFESD